jgi:hypothetical protein
MRTIIIIFLFLITYSGIGQEIKAIGNYYGSNLIIQNPFAETGVGFCIYEVTVNGKIAIEDINSSTFEIDFSNYEIRNRQSVRIIIKHKEGCKPRIINPGVLKPLSTFNVISMTCNMRDSVLKWTTRDEVAMLPFQIQQYKWNKWITIAKVNGKGSASSENTYSYKINLHSGDNIIRLMQKDVVTKRRVSQELKIRTLIRPVKYTFRKSERQIKFSTPTAYEIYNIYGKRKLKGFGKGVDITKLKKGKYFINFDNQMDELKL